MGVNHQAFIFMPLGSELWLVPRGLTIICVQILKYSRTLHRRPFFINIFSQNNVSMIDPYIIYTYDRFNKKSCIIWLVTPDV